MTSPVVAPLDAPPLAALPLVAVGGTEVAVAVNDGVAVGVLPTEVCTLIPTVQALHPAALQARTLYPYREFAVSPVFIQAVWFAPPGTVVVVDACGCPSGPLYTSNQVSFVAVSVQSTWMLFDVTVPARTLVGRAGRETAAAVLVAVAVGGTAVAVGGMAVAVGGMAVAVGGTAVAVAVGVHRGPHET